MKEFIQLITGEGLRNRKECLRLSWLFFLEATNTSKSHEKLYPKAHKKTPTSQHILKSKGAWEDASFLIICPKQTYIFNLNPVIKYINIKLPSNKKLTEEEKNILKALFGLPKIRKVLHKISKEKLSFIELIPKFYFASFYLRYLEEKAGINKIPIKKKQKKYIEEMFEIIKEELDFIINPVEKREKTKGEIEIKPLKLRRKKEDKKIEIKDLISIKGRWTKADERHEREIEYKSYLKFDKHFYYTHYLILHKYYPEIVKSLDEKIKSIIILR